MGTFGYTFLVFIVFGFIAYCLSPARYRQTIVFALSILYFLSYGPYGVIPLIVFLTANHAIASIVERTKPGRSGIIAAVVFNVTFLATFKYLGLFSQTLFALIGFEPVVASAPSHTLRLELIGVSYATFSVLAYQIDLYRGQSERVGFPTLARYLLFFPKLVAGPIVRPKEFMGQVREKSRALNTERFERGLMLISMGMMKKYLVADQLAKAVNNGFDNPASLSLLGSWMLMWAYSIQIYCDFAGYTDMARGIACMFGYELPRNFRSPYVSTNPSEFWNRWHITLSHWFRDYLFIPLGGSRVGQARTYFNLLFVMGLCGFWHGAAWTFLVWGIFHGLLIVGNHIWRNWTKTSDIFNGFRKRLWYRAIAIFVTFQLVTIGWVFFRAGTFGDAWLVLRAMFGGAGFSLSRWPIGGMEVLLIIAGLAGGFLYERVHLPHFAWKIPAVARAAAVTLFVLLVLVVRTNVTEFIYVTF